MEISPETNRQKVTVQVKVQIENADDYLRPDTSATAQFISDSPGSTETRSGGVLVPANALRNEDGRQYVSVVLNDRAVMRQAPVIQRRSEGGCHRGAGRLERGRNHERYANSKGRRPDKTEAKPMIRAALGLIVISNAVFFLFGAVQHAGIPVGWFHAPEIIPGAVVKLPCGVFLPWGSVAIFSHFSGHLEDRTDRKPG